MSTSKRIKIRALYTILAAFGMISLTYKYFKHDLDFSFGLEEDEDDLEQ